jgi:hypothetical protein
MEIPLGLDRESFDRVRDSVALTESLSPRRAAQEGIRQGPQGAPHNWLKMTSTTPATITLASGSTIQGYPAVWCYFDGAGTGWTDTANVVWYVAANLETPVANVRYECRCVGTDSSGVSMWSRGAIPDEYGQSVGQFTGPFFDSQSYYSGQSIVLPTPGTYLISFYSGIMIVPNPSNTSQPGYVQLGVYDLTNTAQVFFAPVVAVCLQNNSVAPVYGTGTAFIFYTPTLTPATLKLWGAQASIGGAAYWDGLLTHTLSSSNLLYRKMQS